MSREALTLPVEGAGRVSALLDLPAQPRAALVLAHGAGAGMQHAFLGQLANELVARDVAVLRFNFAFMQQGVKRPDPPPRAHAAVRSAVDAARHHLPGVPLFAGGKSFGGRMTSQAQALEALPDVHGLVFVGFPLHPAGKPSRTRAEHLAQVGLPMLFLQGTRDTLADIGLVREVTGELADRATLHVIDGADHAFHVLARSGRTDGQVLQELAQVSAAWMAGHAGSTGAGVS
ncbi:MAG TPA: alpha/beta family hydrolase [Ramlibacter sp.]|nr:alpha/beta family hydrolase [Ramlibacter sp.]